MKLDVVDTKGKSAGSVNLNKAIFDGKVNETLMHQAVVIYLANQRDGLASAKTRAEVRGGGKKPWRQKGTGRARVGSSRSPIWVKGGVTFGPKPRDYSKRMPQRMKTLALKSALNAKLKDEAIVVLKDLSLSSHRTVDFCKIMKKLKLTDNKVKLVIEKMDDNIRLATRNVAKVDIVRSSDLSTYAALDCKKLVFTIAALEGVQERISKWLTTKAPTQ